MVSNNRHIPETNIPESQKNEEWYKSFALSIVRNAIDGRYEDSFMSMQESYEFYDGTQSGDEYNFLQTSETGDTLPALWINYNKIRAKVDVLVGELSSKGYEISVKATNKEATSKRLDKKLEMLGMMDIREDLQQLEEISGFPSPPTDNIPETEEEVTEYINETYKDKGEQVMESALKYLIKKYEFDAKRAILFKDLLIAGRTFVKVKIVNGLPTYERVDARRMVIDTTSTDDFLNDASYYGEVEYTSLAEVIDTYNLTETQIEEVQNSENNDLDYGVISNREAKLDFVTGTGSTLKVLVFHAEWQDFKTMKRKVSKDRFGNEHYKKVEDTKKGSDIISRRVKVWRKCTLVGGIIAKDFGIRDNMARSVDDVYDTRSSYVSLCHNFANRNTISKVHQMKGIQKAKDIALYNLQLAMNRAGAKGVAYDVANIPDDWNLDEVMDNLKTSGVMVYNSMKDGIPSSTNPIQEFDLTISNSIGQYISVSNMYDRELNEITGINESRQGQVGSSSQAVGVTQAAISASQFATEPLFEAFRIFSQHIFRELAGLVKIVYGEDRELFSPIIGDAGVDFIKNDVELNLNDYSAFVKMLPPLVVDKNKLENFINIALQSGKIEIEDALDLMFIDDVRDGLKRLKRAIASRASEKAKQEQAQMQAQQQAQAQSQQQQLEMQQVFSQQQEQAKGLRRREEIQQTHQNRIGQEAFKAELRNKQV